MARRRVRATHDVAPVGIIPSAEPHLRHHSLMAPPVFPASTTSAMLLAGVANVGISRPLPAISSASAIFPTGVASVGISSSATPPARHTLHSLPALFPRTFLTSARHLAGVADVGKFSGRSRHPPFFAPPLPPHPSFPSLTHWLIPLRYLVLVLSVVRLGDPANFYSNFRAQNSTVSRPPSRASAR